MRKTPERNLSEEIDGYIELGLAKEALAPQCRSAGVSEGADQLILPGNNLVLLSDEEAICREWQRRFIKMIPKERRPLYTFFGE